MSKVSKELIESYRKIVLPFVSNQLCKANFEGQGTLDKAEFEQDFNEILNLAITSLNPSGDCISRSDLKDKMKKAEEQADTFEMLVEFYEQIVDNAQAVEPERPQGEWVSKRLWDNTHIWVCSECGNQNKHGITVEKACWKCGAKMKGGTE